MRDDITNLITPCEPAATIGEMGLRLRRSAPLQRSIDVYDTAGRLHGLIALAPIAYGIFQTQLGRPLQPWFWWMVVATTAFAVFGRRVPYLRLDAKGISFPESGSARHPWDQMCEAHARGDGLDILMHDGQRVTILFRNLRASDVQKVKRLIRSQFEAMAAASSGCDPAPLNRAA